MITMNDPIGKYYPKAKDAMAALNATYFTYEQFKAFVQKYSGKNHWGYHGHQTEVYEPSGEIAIGIIGLLYHNSPTEQEFVISYTPSAYAMKHPGWGMPIQSYFIQDLDTAFALMIALAYPGMELMEAVLNCPINMDAALQHYQDITPGWCDFTEEQMTQFVKNLSG